MRVMSVVGARPQFIKLAPIVRAMGKHDRLFDHAIVHTGQHYDPKMSSTIFRDLRVPQPDVDLKIGSGPHGQQTGRMLEALEALICDVEKPDVVLVYGDTNSTLAGALAAVKLHIPVAHLEAGLRSHNRKMPEEINRVAVDHISDLLLAPTAEAISNLKLEGRESVFVGDVMADLCISIVHSRGELAQTTARRKAPYYACTLHRAENTDDPERLRSVLDALSRLDLPTVLVAHPRLVAKAREFGLKLDIGAVELSEPLGYTDMLTLMMRSSGVVTDSGGLQKEAYFLGVPCTTVRYETEWPETLANNWNMLSPAPEDLARKVGRKAPDIPPDISPFGDGHAAEKVCAELLRIGHG